MNRKFFFLKIKKSEGNYFTSHIQTFTQTHPKKYLQAVADIQLLNWHVQKDSHPFCIHSTKAIH